MARSKDFDESEILNKAVGVFWLKGYNGTSMQDLIDALGISRSSLYDTYVDKHTLYLKALEFYQNNASCNMTSITGRAASSKEGIRNLLQFIVDNLIEDEDHKGCLMVNAEVESAPHDPEIMDLVCKNEKQIEQSFYDAIKTGQEKGEISRKQDAMALTRFFLNTVKGIRVSAKSTTDRAFFDDIIKTSMSILE